MYASDGCHLQYRPGTHEDRPEVEGALASGWHEPEVAPHQLLDNRDEPIGQGTAACTGVRPHPRDADRCRSAGRAFTTPSSPRTAPQPLKGALPVAEDRGGRCDRDIPVGHKLPLRPRAVLPGSPPET